MGRRKLGQPRVHRIIIMDQYSNEIESYELDEYGRLKKKIVTKRPYRSLSQGKSGLTENGKNHQKATLQLPQNFYEMQNSKSQLNSELSTNSPIINPIKNSNENKSSTPSYKSPSTSKMNHYKEGLNKSLYNNIPQPKILPSPMEGTSSVLPMKSNQIFQKIQSEDPEHNNIQPIPIPVLMPPTKNGRAQHNSNQSAISNINKNLYDNSSSITKKLDFVQKKYLSFQIIIDIPEEPCIPLFITPDE